MKKLLNQWKKDGQVKQWAEKGLQGIHEQAVHYIYTQPKVSKPKMHAFLFLNNCVKLCMNRLRSCDIVTFRKPYNLILSWEKTRSKVLTWFTISDY